MRTDKLAACHTVSTPATDLHCTPRAFFEYVQKKFGVKFTIDIAASKRNTLCKKYISKKEDALRSIWHGIAWCNPPYSQAAEFVRRCYSNALQGHGSVFMLMAARTDREWWKLTEGASHIIFIKGRLKFSGAKAGAPFPSVLIVFKKSYTGKPKLVYLDPSPYERGFQRGKPE